MFFVLSRACNKEKLLSPYEELKIRPLYWATETLRWARSITKSMTRVLHTARTRNVDSVTVDNFFLYPTFVTRRKTSFAIFMYFNLEISDRRLNENAFFFVSSFQPAFCQITSWKVYQTDFLTAFPSWHICEWNSNLTKEIIVKNQMIIFKILFTKA